MKEKSIETDLLDATEETAASRFDVAERLKRWAERKRSEGFVSFG